MNLRRATRAAFGLALLVAVQAVSASADIVTWSIAGALIEFPELDEGPFVEGDLVVVEARIDTAAPNLGPVPGPGAFDALESLFIEFPERGLAFRFGPGLLPINVFLSDDLGIDDPETVSVVDWVDVAAPEPQEVDAIDGRLPTGAEIRFEDIGSGSAPPDLITGGEMPRAVEDIHDFGVGFCFDALCADKILASFLPTATPVPEPAVEGGMAAAALGLAVTARRRARRRSRASEGKGDSGCVSSESDE